MQTQLLIANKFITGLFCLLMSICSWAQVKPVILVLGDSLSAEYGLPRGTGWVTLLEGELAKEKSPWSVFNASISGETSSGGLTRLPNLLSQKKPGIVLIELGANDALRGLPVNQTEANLRQMIQMSKKSGAKVLLCGIQIPSNYGQTYTKQFKQLYPQIANQERVELLPFFLEGVATKPELFQADRLHPNVEAQSIIFKNVWGSMAPYSNLLKKLP
ncbi:arylesterase [Polynucleobacter sp. AP-Sving-400A-A2]|uniref:arylesterase n=1 Tax=Polynucleobacter sp. AP-Sving-400A-A2 TaxID=2081049 RepID=UPI001BFE33A5|nr:arylesterase [Polynucleobacter sp. AP-Sving-400A-A2]QWE15528.1 arylesterase [Polynucleobacter sp. AP-Sving-400A-A2]